MGAGGGAFVRAGLARPRRAKPAFLSAWPAFGRRGRASPARTNAGPSVLARPGQRIGLHVGEALHRLEHAFLVAEAGILDAAEGRHLYPVSRNFPDVDRADVELVDEPRDVIESVGA